MFHENLPTPLAPRIAHLPTNIEIEILFIGFNYNMDSSSDLFLIKWIEKTKNKPLPWHY